MQCQAILEPWDQRPGGLALGSGARCPRRAVSSIENRFVCRQHLSAALYRLRGLPDPRALWWEMQSVEARGECPLCGEPLQRLPAARLTPEGTLSTYAPCHQPSCAEQREVAQSNAAAATLPD